jgi:predicted NAD/FAD-binding protein
MRIYGFPKTGPYDPRYYRNSRQYRVRNLQRAHRYCPLHPRKRSARQAWLRDLRVLFNDCNNSLETLLDS